MKLKLISILTATLATQASAAHFMIITQDGLDDSWVTALTAEFPGSTFDTGLYQDYTAPATTTAVAAADLIVFSRDTNSVDYSNQGSGAERLYWNSLNKPIILSNYLILRDSRQGWTDGSSTASSSGAGSETALTAAGATYFGLAAGNQDLLVNLTYGTTATSMDFGDGTVLATNAGNSSPSIVSWDSGDLAGGGDIFGGERIYFATANTTLPGDDFVFTPTGQAAIGTIVNTMIPEPGSATLALVGIGLVALRRRRR